MIKNRIKALDLDGMIVRSKGFTADFEVNNTSKGNSRLSIYLRSSNRKIHSAKYTSEDGLGVLIENLEVELESSENKKDREVYIELLSRIKAI